VIQIATGHESGGIDVYLDTKRGTIMVDIVRMGYDDTYDLKEYFDQLKEKYRSFELLRVPGATVFDKDRDEMSRAVSESEAYSQRGVGFGSRVDKQWIRQIYRSHGWPYKFRKNDAMQALEAFERRRDAEWSLEKEEVSKEMAYGQRGVPYGSWIDEQWTSQLYCDQSSHENGDREAAQRAVEEFVEMRMAEENNLE
jgi:hypothetical protein